MKRNEPGVRRKFLATHPCIIACRSRSAAVCECCCALTCWPSCDAVVMTLALRRPSQLRDIERVDALVGLCGAVAGADTTKVDIVGTALLDLVARCPSGRGGRLWRGLPPLLSGRSFDRRRFCPGDVLRSRGFSTLSTGPKLVILEGLEATEEAGPKPRENNDVLPTTVNFVELLGR